MPDSIQQRRKQKNLALLLVLVILIGLIYAITIMKMGLAVSPHAPH